MTLIALDPIRDAAFKTAFDAHLNALRADGTTVGMTWRQVEVEAFVRTITAGVRPARPGGDRRDLSAAVPRGFTVGATCCAAAHAPVTPIEHRRRPQRARDLRRHHARSAARRLLHPRVVRDQRRPGRCLRRRCDACCATPSSTRPCSAVTAKCSTPAEPSAPSTANNGERSGRCTAPALIPAARCRSSRAASTTSAGGPATAAQPTSKISCPYARHTITSCTRAAGRSP